MIDNPKQVDRLLADLDAALPIAVTLSSAVQAMLRNKPPGGSFSAVGRVTRVDYAGDEGGIMCKVEFEGGPGESALFVSITHLRFSGASRLVRDIAVYQKHRDKKIRRAMGPNWGGMIVPPTGRV